MALRCPLGVFIAEGFNRVKLNFPYAPNNPYCPAFFRSPRLRASTDGPSYEY